MQSLNTPNVTRTTCPYCGVGCGVAASVTAAGTVLTGDKFHPANFGRLCSKGAALAETLDHDGRLLYPLANGQRISWDEALDQVAHGFGKIIAEHGPDAVAFYVSGQLLTEDYYVANKLMKGFIGSANIDTNSRLCMSSAVAAHKRAFGADVVPVCYEDIETADLVVITGSNYAWAHPVLYQRLATAKKARPDMRVVVIDPRRTSTCDIADLHLAIAPGSDAHLFNGLLNFIRRENALDLAYVEAHVEGFAAAFEAARGAGSIPKVAQVCGIPEAEVSEFFRLFARTERTVTIFSQGINQSSSGVDKGNAIINVHLATGRIGHPGMGPFSVTGQPNAMGGREVGGLANQLAAHMDFSNAADIDLVARFWNAPNGHARFPPPNPDRTTSHSTSPANNAGQVAGYLPPAGEGANESQRDVHVNMAQAPGLKAVEMFQAIASGKIKAVWIMGTNPVVSMPDADRVRAALLGCELVVVSDCVQHTDTTACADILLPAAGWGEKDGTVTNSERRISRQRSLLAMAGEARPDWWIITQVAQRMGFADAFPYTRPAEIFREHARLSGFENTGGRAFDISALAELDDVEYDALQPVQWPVNRQAPQGTARLFDDGHFYTPSGKARMIAVAPRLPAVAADKDFPLVLNTGRIRDQWHTMTRTGKVARLNAQEAEPFVQVHASDAHLHRLQHGGLARLTSRNGTMLARVQVSEDQRPGSVFVPMHWNDAYARSARVDALAAPITDPISGQPESKHTPVRIEPYLPAWQGFVLSRTRLDFMDAIYCARALGESYWRHEIAGEVTPDDWRDWARAALENSGAPARSTPVGARQLRCHPSADWLEYRDVSMGRYRAASLRDGKLEAIFFIATDQRLPEREWLGSLFGKQRLESGDVAGLLAARPPCGSADTGRNVCACFNVGEKTILDAIRTRELDSTEAVGACLKAGTGCGSCVPEIRRLLDSARA
ncbi:nitrate reductase [mine drainage metagenome]|uniref:Nitrate reductase n=1 Tax=mine drainage metagenome TaxID=410659 RepID=A0A1J5TH75_9ZZZZ